MCIRDRAHVVAVALDTRWADVGSFASLYLELPLSLIHIYWSIDGATTSQFENHLRAVAGLPLGWTEERQPWCTMRNVLGGARKDLLAALPAVLGDGGLKVQLYGKAWRQGRKMAHVTAYGADLADVQERARAAAHYLMGDDDVMEDDGE